MTNAELQPFRMCLMLPQKFNKILINGKDVLPWSLLLVPPARDLSRCLSLSFRRYWVTVPFVAMALTSSLGLCHQRGSRFWVKTIRDVKRYPGAVLGVCKKGGGGGGSRYGRFQAFGIF